TRSNVLDAGLVCCALSVQWCAASRALLSFPTRRSSDLYGGCRDGPGRQQLQLGLGVADSVPWVSSPSRSHHSIPPIISFTRKPRSEEHTSELQSPDHLVCRLLLEKKNDSLTLEYEKNFA